MGVLELEETTDGVSWAPIWTKSGNQGSSWQGASVSIATADVIKVRWVATTGSSYTSDMAVDDVDILHSCSCSSQTSPVPTLQPTTALPSVPCFDIDVEDIAD